MVLAAHVPVSLQPLPVLLEQREFGKAPDPRQRTFQVMGNIVAHLPDALDQIGDPVKHVVEGDGQPVQLIFAAGLGHPLIQIVAGDGVGGLGNGLYPGQSLACQKIAGHSGKENNKGHGDPEHGFKGPDKPGMGRSGQCRSGEWALWATKVYMIRAFCSWPSTRAV